MKVILFRDYKEENWHSMEVYADSLAGNLRKIARDLTIKEFIALPQVSGFFPSRHKYIRQIFRYLVNPAGAVFQNADIYHITDHANAHLLAILNPERTIITCHDLTAPYWMKNNVKLTVKKRIRHTVEAWRLGFMKRAAGIIAVSEATKTDIVRTLGIDKHKITVISEGVDPLFCPVGKLQLEDFSRKIRLPRRYLLHVGTTYTNKNIAGLLRIFSLLANNDRTLFLVKVGDPWTDEQIGLIDSLPESDRIVHAGFVETSQLPYYYSGALALLQPSYAEGFGFTVLEAMACGCPVVVSDIPALRELVADCGVYIDPYNEKQSALTLKNLLRNRGLRGVLQANGIKRAKLYSWEQCARKTYKLYQWVAQESVL